MCTIPSFVRSRVDDGENILDMGKSAYKSGRKIWDTVTLNPTRLFIKQSQQKSAKNLLALRKKHGQRFVKGLK